VKKRYRVLVIFFVVAVAGVFVPPALAHPLGNFSINLYAGLRIRTEAIEVDYVMDFAELPAFQEISALDMDGSGNAEASELGSYPDEQCQAVRSALVLRVNGRSLALAKTSAAIELPPGQGGLPTLRLTCAFRAVLPGSESGGWQVEFENQVYAGRLGWREIVVTREGVKLEGQFAAHSLSERLTRYPNDLLASPLDQRQVVFRVEPGSASLDARGATSQDRLELPARSALTGRDDAFTRLVLLEDLSLPAVLLALGIAFAWGAAHALTPGHGKTIVGAYLVGSRGTAVHALYLGLATTITHTAGIYLLGFVTLIARRYILPERLFPWLGLLSGLLVVGIGGKLFLERLAAAGFKLLQRPGSAQGHLHPHQHLSGYKHDYSSIPPHFQGHNHGADPEHGHPHDHEPHHGYGHSYDQEPDDEHGHPQDHVHDHGHGQSHAHTHLPPGSDGAPVTWRSLLALGISGGLLPCPSAMVVMLGAIALDRAGFGLLLVLAFSLGLASVLSGIGLLFVVAGRRFERLPLPRRALPLLPAASALFILLAGVGIALKALAELGIR
jgi:ABC-type nickel/cobalt efflux system permease component RcnA